MKKKEKATLLLVDDAQVNLVLLSDILEKEYTLKVAKNGKKALEIAKAGGVDLILLDIVMPEMDGYEVCQRLQEDLTTKDIPIIFVTANTQAEDEEKGFAYGAVDYITKPFRAATILARVKTHLALSLKQQELEKEIALAIEDTRKKDIAMNRQAKAAAMGEMIDTIAHQWRTPLNIINLYVIDTQFMLHNTSENKQESIDKNLDNIMLQIEHLNDTLNSFRNFFRPLHDLEDITIQKLVDSTLLILKDELLKNKIVVETKGDLDLTICVVANELQHVLLNLINNAKDAFIEHQIQKRKITIEGVSISPSVVEIRVSDNAGGIAEDTLEHIFEPHFTTKHKSGGTGIGLYMCTQILDKIGAGIDAKNEGEGASFSIKIDKASSLYYKDEEEEG